MADNKNKGEKRRHRFNIVDLLIILALATVAISVAFRYNLAEKIGVTSEDDTVIISFLVQDIKETSADALVLGDMFYWELNGILIGELISKKPSFAEAFVENDEGILVKLYNENNYDVRGEIKAKGKIKDEGFMLGGRQFLAPGKVLYVQSRNIMVNMTITDITRAGS
ncbi:MAG: DUF4330 family protein [Eubacteriales bacterium]|jgi:hypothetical protein|nr:DUF4330 family protein [Eubacteriales bacterium]